MSRSVVIATIFLMCCAMTVRAQWPVDSVKNKILPELATKHQNDMLTIDGVVIADSDVKAKLATLTPLNVFDVVIIDQKLREKLNFNSGHDIVVVTTKAAVKASYQKTLSALSLDYRNYLEANQNDDSHLQYILNSQPLRSGSEEQLDRLYKLGPEKITNVSLTTIDGKKTLIIDINFDE